MDGTAFREQLTSFLGTSTPSRGASRRMIEQTYGQAMVGLLRLLDRKDPSSGRLHIAIADEAGGRLPAGGRVRKMLTTRAFWRYLPGMFLRLPPPEELVRVEGRRVLARSLEMCHEVGRREPSAMRVLHFGRFHKATSVASSATLRWSSALRESGCDNLVANEMWAGECSIWATTRSTRHLLWEYWPAWHCARPLWARRRIGCMPTIMPHFPDPLAHLVWYTIPRGPRLVISWHSDIVRQERMLAWYRPFLDQIVGRADAIIAATPRHFTGSTQLRACRDESRKHIVPYGIDLRPYQATAESLRKAAEIRGRYPGKRLVFGVGRHVYYKGFEYLVRAMNDVPDAVAIIGGTGPLSGMYTHLVADLGLESKVGLVGRIDDADLPAYYHACDLYCLPSTEKSEAFGIVQLEAMACGKPVVCSRLDNGVNYVSVDEVTGLAVPPRDPKALARAINRLLDDEALRVRLGTAGLARVKDHFTMERMGRTGPA
jgi:rhamnosyl/mannosyltransferase